MLIEGGANINQIDKDHFTPLIYGMEAIENVFCFLKIFPFSGLS
jgi:hypothetical protein